tara:strand:- start:12683 stop:13147 length:465 start_codon:yes stop_codon:yes gene_type:complete
MAENRSKSDGFMLRFPPGLRDRVKADADERGRSMNAEVIWRIENFEKAQEAWAATDAELTKFEKYFEIDQSELKRLYQERGKLFETMNNQERTLQALRESHRTLSIMVRSLGEAILKDGDRSEFVRILAAGLSEVEIDTSSEASEPLPHEPWEH